jgi:hypothetical protein
LVLVPIWTRRRGHAVLIGAWLLVNPVVFPKPADDRAWASRAMLGEELWIVDRPRDGSVVVSAITSLVAIFAMLAARRHRVLATVVTTAVQMALTLVYWHLMVRYFDRRRR